MSYQTAPYNHSPIMSWELARAFVARKRTSCTHRTGRGSEKTSLPVACRWYHLCAPAKSWKRKGCPVLSRSASALALTYQGKASVCPFISVFMAPCGVTGCGAACGSFNTGLSARAVVLGGSGLPRRGMVAVGFSFVEDWITKIRRKWALNIRTALRRTGLPCTHGQVNSHPKEDALSFTVSACPPTAMAYMLPWNQVTVATQTQRATGV